MVRETSSYMASIVHYFPLKLLLDSIIIIIIIIIIF